MVMNSGGYVSKTNTPGVYRMKLQAQTGGDWVAKLSWQGQASSGVGFRIAMDWTPGAESSTNYIRMPQPCVRGMSILFFAS
jgi:hypothetical protein